MNHKKYKLAILVSNPVHYHVPIYKELHSKNNIDLTIYFCSDYGIREGLDTTFGEKIKWYDENILEGLNYKFLKNLSLQRNIGGFFGLINPGIISELKREKYDAVIVFGYTKFTNWLVFLTKWFHKTPIIIKGEADLNKKISFFKKLFKKIILKPLFSILDAFLYSYKLNKEFFEYYGAKKENIFPIPCAVDNKELQEKRKYIKPKKVKENLGINGENKVILFLGKFIPRKRPFDVLEAYKLLVKEHYKEENTPYLVMVGSGPLKEKLRRFTEINNLEKVIFTGFKKIPEIPSMYSITDIFVLSSEFDPSPKVINEAMNFSLPIIVSTGVSTAEDLVLKNNCGFRYKTGDIKSLAGKIKTLLDNDELRETMGRNSYYNVMNLWNTEKDVEGIMKALSYIKSKRNKNKTWKV
jgi:glycosyltransferase involved in cell wall biosynthesis